MQQKYALETSGEDEILLDFQMHHSEMPLGL